MKFSQKRCIGLRLRYIWIVTNEYYNRISWFAVMDEFGTLVKVMPEQSKASLS